MAVLCCLQLFRKEPKVEPKVQFDQTISILSKPTGNYEADKKRATDYAKGVGMDSANTKIAIIMATEGPQEAAKIMIQESNGDYGLMRRTYG